MNETILLLGGSKQQVIAIEKAKELGYRTILCDYLPDNPGQFVADTFYQVSTTDRDAVLEVAEKEHINGIISYASDPAAPTAAYVAERMGLPTNPLSSVEILSQKHLFRDHLRNAGLPCPKAASFSASSSSEFVIELTDGFSYPLVIKPTDSSGSRGVSIVKGKERLTEAIAVARQRSRNQKLIVEEYIERSFPYVIGGDIFVVDGKVVFWGLMSCLRDEAVPLVPVGERYPSGLSPRQLQKVEDVLQHLVTSLDITMGELNVEVLLGNGDEPFVLELAARAGGNMIPVQLAEGFGIDLVKANILCAMGKSVHLSEGNQPSGAFMTFVLHALSDGVFAGVDYSQTALEALHREVLYKLPGDIVEHFSGADKALGIVFLHFSDESAMINFVHEIDNHIKVMMRS